MQPLVPENPDPRGRDVAAAKPRQGARPGRNLGRDVCTTLAVLAGAALALRALDAIPGWVSGLPRGVHLCANVAEAEARTGLDLRAIRQGLGDYALAADGIRAAARPVPAVAVTLQSRKGTLTFFRSRGATIPATLRPPLASFHEIAVPIEPGRMASLKAESQADGTVWQDMEWSDRTGRTALRFQGRTVELLRLARRLAEKSP